MKVLNPIAFHYRLIYNGYRIEGYDEETADLLTLREIMRYNYREATVK